MRPLTAATLATLLLTTGCTTSVPDKAVAIGLAEERARVEQAAVDVAAALRDADVDVADEATASYRSCRDDPGPAVDLTVTFTSVGADPSSDRAGRIADALSAAGWEVRPADAATSDLGSLRRGDLTLLLSGSGAEPDAVVLGVTGECVEAAPDEVAGLLAERASVDLR